jgi:MFS transporter, UMF1 family
MKNLSPSQKKTINAWCMYDWANSVYNLVITTTFFPIYYLGITGDNDSNTKTATLNFLWFKDIPNTSLYDYTLALAFLLVAISSPLLSSIADLRGNKKRFMQFFVTIGALSCIGFYFFKSIDHLLLGSILFITATYGYWASLVFYNSYLPEIAPPKLQDRVSARGFSYGYVGSVILQIIGFVILLSFPSNGSSQALAVRITFILVGLWWLGFALYTFKYLPKPITNHTLSDKNVISSGFLELIKVLKEVRSLPILLMFLLAFFFYNMGVQTVMLVATTFGSETLKLDTTTLILTVVVIQLVAILGALVMSRASERIGNIKVLLTVVILWILVCIYSFYFLNNKWQFFIVAAVVGLIMGGIQSLSRSTYSKLMPATSDTASYFSFFDVTEKIAIVIGMFSFGFINHLTGSMRNSILSLVVFFAIGCLFLLRVLKLQKNLTA